MLEAGAHLPEFQLERLGGGVETRDSVSAGKRALLAFFKVSCPVCQFTFPFLERIHQASDANVFGVSQDNGESTGAYNRRFGVTFPTLLDPADQDYPASNAFGISSVPSMFLVEPDGKISWASHGFSKRDLEALGKMLDAAPFRAGEQVPEWQPG